MGGLNQIFLGWSRGQFVQFKFVTNIVFSLRRFGGCALFLTAYIYRYDTIITYRCNSVHYCYGVLYMGHMGRKIGAAAKTLACVYVCLRSGDGRSCHRFNFHGSRRHSLDAPCNNGLYKSRPHDHTFWLGRPCYQARRGARFGQFP